MNDFTVFDSIELLDAESRYLIHKAKEAAAHAYAPYSKFHVGAALILSDGNLITGSNQENASYPLCMCGERVALYAAAAQFPGVAIKSLAVVAFRKGHKNLVAATPCGACRQVLHEYEERQKNPFSVIFFGPGEKWYRTGSASALLPMAFDKAGLGH
jgi:cytidine deaminase